MNEESKNQDFEIDPVKNTESISKSEEKKLEDISTDYESSTREREQEENRQKTKDFLDKVETSKKKKEEYDGVSFKNPQEQMEDALERMDNKLTSALAHLVEPEKKRLEEAQYQGIFKKIFRKIGYQAKEVKDSEALDNVLGNLSKSANKTMDTRKAYTNEAKEAVEKRRLEYSSLKQDRNKDYDLHEQGEKRLNSLEEELTTTIKARDTHLEEKNKPNYQGEVDTLLQNEVETIEGLEEEMAEIKYAQEVLADNIEDYQYQLERSEGKKEEAEGNYELAKQTFRDAKRIAEDLNELKSDKKGKSRLMDFYKSLTEDAKILGDATKVIEHSGTVIKEVFESYAKVAKENPVSGGSHNNSLRQYRNKREKEREDVISKVKAQRYALS